jgi:microcystin-dependent protein
LSAQQTTNTYANSNPVLNVKDISDNLVQQNFQSLANYFLNQNQFLNFKFVEVVFTAAQKNMLINHGLGYVPLDIVPTLVTGVGSVTFNIGLFDKTNLNLTSSGACRVRFFYGLYWKSGQAAATATTDSFTVSGSGGGSSSGGGGTASPLTTKGDLYTYSTVNARQPVGPDGSILVADSTQTTGLNWATGSDGTPVGTVITNGQSTPPPGYLPANGALVSRTKYAALFAALGSTYGAGDGSTTFGLPNLSGIFASFAGGQTVGAFTYGRTAGTAQQDTFRDHSHAMGVSSVDSTTCVPGASRMADFDGGFGGPQRGTVGAYAGQGNGAETYPANQAFYAYIKYTAVVTQTSVTPTIVHSNALFSIDLSPGGYSIGTNGTIPWDTLIVDTVSGWNNSSKIYTIQPGQAGYYMVSNSRWANVQAENYMVTNRGSGFAAEWYSGTSLAGQICGNSKIFHFNVGDQIYWAVDSACFMYGPASGIGGNCGGNNWSMHLL